MAGLLKVRVCWFVSVVVVCWLCASSCIKAASRLYREPFAFCILECLCGNGSIRSQPELSVGAAEGTQLPRHGPSSAPMPRQSEEQAIRSAAAAVTAVTTVATVATVAAAATIAPSCHHHPITTLSPLYHCSIAAPSPSYHRSITILSPSYHILTLPSSYRHHHPAMAQMQPRSTSWLRSLCPATWPPRHTGGMD
ncbi:hypothetical protein GQ42DRAFT_166111 [Ramicandelaber brevisporus]|nr:hypothetical protein GQ42DRAFT_166111 [Ramicandelaber brevisporus]